MTRTLLFTGGGGAGSVPLYRLLSPTHDVHFCDANPIAKPQSLPESQWHVVPMAGDALFLRQLDGLCVALGIDVLVPGVDEELLRIAMWREHLNCAVLLPETEFIATHLDKLRSNRVLGEAGIPIPRTDRFTKRVILKPREGRGSRGVQIVGPDVIQQELLQGQEYTVTMVAGQGRQLRAVVPVRVEDKQGVTVRGVTDRNPDVMAACQRIHAVQPTSGLYNIQGMLTKTGFLPFEINPRISTTACLVMTAGVDVIGLAMAEDDGSDELAPFQAGMTIQRTHVTINREWWETQIA